MHYHIIYSKKINSKKTFPEIPTLHITYADFLSIIFCHQ